MRAILVENELNYYYKNSFNLKTRVFFPEENVVIPVSYTLLLLNEEYSSLKFSDDINYIVDSLTNIHFRQNLTTISNGK